MYSRCVTETEHATDWQRQWEHEPLDLAAPQAEARTPRWRAQEELVRARFGGFDGLRVVELGAGRGLNGLLYAQRGANVTLVDNLDLPLAQAKRLFDANDAAGRATASPTSSSSRTTCARRSTSRCPSASASTSSASGGSQSCARTSTSCGPAGSR